MQADALQRAEALQAADDEQKARAEAAQEKLRMWRESHQLLGRLGMKSDRQVRMIVGVAALAVVLVAGRAVLVARMLGQLSGTWTTSWTQSGMDSKEEMVIDGSQARLRSSRQVDGGGWGAWSEWRVGNINPFTGSFSNMTEYEGKTLEAKFTTEGLGTAGASIKDDWGGGSLGVDEHTWAKQ